MNNFKNLINKTNFLKNNKKFFGHGPFNPMMYKYKLVSEKKLTTEEEYYIYKKVKEFDNLPVYNMRSVHPIRQSGPIPAYYGDYTMEDIRHHVYHMKASFEAVPESTDIDELMRRVPGLTRKEALKIQSLGFSPYEELDYAYLVVNNGLDVFYEPNHAYIARQVLTNSKGEKVECLIPTNEPDEITYSNISMHAGFDRMDHAYDPVPGEPPLLPQPDYELGVPYSWFEYEADNRLHEAMTYDQQYIPEDERPFPSPKNPNCSKDLWKPQQDIKEENEMENPEWYPNQTAYNVYGKKDFFREKIDYQDKNIN